jgi:alanine racemase
MAIIIAEINTKNICHNLQKIRDKTKDKYILAMVKANAYGHGMIEISKFLRTQDIEYLGVAFIHEAVKIRQAGDNGKILVMVSPEPQDADLFIDYNIETAFSSFKILKYYEKRAIERDVIIYGHLYIDTGMHRDGMAIEDAIPFMDYVKDNPNIKITGLMTHLATADMPDIAFANKQLERFENIRKELDTLGYKFKYIHCSNSAGIPNYPSAHYNMVRPGISIYGMMSNKQMAKEMDLKPVLSWKSKVMHCVNVPKGDYIGYSNSPAYPYFAKTDMEIAVVPSGYADGLPRSLTNKLQCLINGKRFNSVGSICMDEFMVDITGEKVKQGDEVVIIGEQGDEEISVYELAELAHSIPYERTSAISDRVKRVFV